MKRLGQIGIVLALVIVGAAFLMQPGFASPPESVEEEVIVYQGIVDQVMAKGERRPMPEGFAQTVGGYMPGNQILYQHLGNRTIVTVTMADDPDYGWFIEEVFPMAGRTEQGHGAGPFDPCLGEPPSDNEAAWSEQLRWGLEDGPPRGTLPFWKHLLGKLDSLP